MAVQNTPVPLDAGIGNSRNEKRDWDMDSLNKKEAMAYVKAFAEDQESLEFDAFVKSRLSGRKVDTAGARALRMFIPGAFILVGIVILLYALH